jgi:hypothetical protein
MFENVGIMCHTKLLSSLKKKHKQTKEEGKQGGIFFALKKKHNGFLYFLWLQQTCSHLYDSIYYPFPFSAWSMCEHSRHRRVPHTGTFGGYLDELKQ